MPVYGVQLAFAGIFFVLLVCACPLLRLPPPGYTVATAAAATDVAMTLRVRRVALCGKGLVGSRSADSLKRCRARVLKA